MSEYTEQVALFQWAAWVEPRLPALRRLAHWPNGEKRDKVTAARLKRAGVKRGPVDCWLFARSGDCPGMAFEMKAPGGRPTTDQREWLADLARQGWRTGVYTDWQAAARAICDHLGVNPADYGIP